MFHHMDTDDVVQDILQSINKILELDDDDEVTLWNVVHIAVEKHNKDILEKVYETEKEIADRIITYGITIEKSSDDASSDDESENDDGNSFNQLRAGYQTLKRKNTVGYGMHLNPW